MRQATYVSAYYRQSETIKAQGNYNNITKYLIKGFSVQLERNGYWVLIKPVKVVVFLIDQNGVEWKFNMKQDILRFYSQKKISKKLFERFVQDCENGKIQFSMDESGHYGF